MKDYAKQSFDDIKTYADIKKFVSSRAREGTYLDFKTIHQAKGNNVDKDIQKALSKAASSFAHQKGGVIVWGIEAKQIKDTDCAQTEIPINNLSEIFKIIDKFSFDCIEPRLYLEHKLIYLNDDDTTDIGFIVSFFPKSDAIHCANYADYNFYQRHGDKSLPMITGDDLKRVLNRNLEPKLELIVVVSPTAHTTKPNGEKIIKEINYQFSIKNIGNVIAEYPSIELDFSVDIRNIYSPGGHNNFVAGSFIPTNKNDQKSRLFIPNAGIVVHPTQELCIGNLSFNASMPPRVDYKCYAKNMQPIEGFLQPIIDPI